MSFPKIESRKPVHEPFGDPPKYHAGDRVRLRQHRERIRSVLKVEWHAHRYQWVYIIETSTSDQGSYFEPYWFEDRLELVERRNESL